MTSRSRMIHTATVLALSLVIAFTTSIEAQSKRRAVKPTAPPAGAAPASVILTGTILDATTNAPVTAVLVRHGSHSGRTDANGVFRVDLASGAAEQLTFERVGYDPFSATVTITGNDTKTFRMISQPTVKIRLTSGSIYEVDTDTVEFGYVAPFSGYNKDSKLNLCKSGGESFTPDRSEIKRITPAATPLTDAKCCATPVSAINVEMKSGGTSTAGFVDACFGYKVDIIALDHNTAAPVYFHFSDVSELTFP